MSASHWLCGAQVAYSSGRSSSGKCRGFALVDYMSYQDAEKAHRVLNNFELAPGVILRTSFGNPTKLGRTIFNQKAANQAQKVRPKQHAAPDTYGLLRTPQGSRPFQIPHHVKYYQEHSRQQFGFLEQNSSKPEFNINLGNFQPSSMAQAQSQHDPHNAMMQHQMMMIQQRGQPRAPISFLNNQSSAPGVRTGFYPLNPRPSMGGPLDSRIPMPVNQNAPCGMRVPTLVAPTLLPTTPAILNQGYPQRNAHSFQSTQLNTDRNQGPFPRVHIQPYQHGGKGCSAPTPGVIRPPTQATQSRYPLAPHRNCNELVPTLVTSPKSMFSAGPAPQNRKRRHQPDYVLVETKRQYSTQHDQGINLFDDLKVIQADVPEFKRRRSNRNIVIRSTIRA